NSPPGKHRLALEDAGGVLAGGPHSPNRPAHRPHVEERGVGRFLCAEAAVFRHLHRTAARGWYLPNLPIPRPIGGEIDPFAVSRPRRDIVFDGIAGETAGRASIGADDEDVTVAFEAGIKRNGLAIRRPAWRAGIGGLQGCQLGLVRAVAIASPNLDTARAVGREGDPLAIGRKEIGRASCRERGWMTEGAVA